MNITLWIVQGLVATVFAASGSQKATRSREALVASGQTGVQDLSLPFVRFVAWCELLGAVGLLLPGIMHVATWLTPLAASGFAILMVGAASIHSKRHEPRTVATNLVLLALSVLIVVGRTLV
jgi:DoxX-like family